MRKRRPLGTASTSRRPRSPPFFRGGPAPRRTTPRPRRCPRPRCPPEATCRVAPTSAPSAPAPNEAVTTGRSGVPATVAVVMSALATRRPRSDGLIGEASTRTNTSLAAGVGTGTSCSESSERALRRHQRTQFQCTIGQICGHGWCLVPVSDGCSDHMNSRRRQKSSPIGCAEPVLGPSPMSCSARRGVDNSTSEWGKPLHRGPIVWACR